MPIPPPSDAEQPPAPRPERRVLARAVNVWWVRRLLEAARCRHASGQAREDQDLPHPSPMTR